ncbi:MAG: 2-amino-4-hydroxy-6-hydroxymethyldihydropteridine diphosphokinase [Nakamurella sp.]
MTTAVLSLGSNMGDSSGYLRDAVRGLGAALRHVSSVYRTPPWGPVEQDDFLNIAVVVADPLCDAPGWLARCHELERAANRERLVHWGPRTLDADVVAVWQQPATERRGGETVEYDAVLGSDTSPVVSTDPVLTLPHPRSFERGFVLVPWAEIQPAADLPGHGAIATLIAALDVSDIVRVGALDGAAGSAREGVAEGLSDSEQR